MGQGNGCFQVTGTIYITNPDTMTSSNGLTIRRYRTGDTLQYHGNSG